jgi:Na+/melibiose symporter-like transporter
MKMFKITKKKEDNVIAGGIIVFWMLFWVLNSVDKVLYNTTLWQGKDRLSQFVDYFATIGLDNLLLPVATLFVVSILEFLAAIFSVFAFGYMMDKDKVKARGALFYTVLTSLVIFSFFAIGDQIFGDRGELLEHSIYWIILVLSWFIYTRTEK